MSEQLFKILKKKLEAIADFGELDAETRRNALKEELQFFVLNFIYHHPRYSQWIMYGGSALRVIHGLDRMSVDLDFEISNPVTEKFLEELKKEIEKYFANTYGADADFLKVKINNNRGLLLKFFVGKELALGQHSDQVHVKVDLNYFVVEKAVTERRPINRDQMSFVILTYNMSALMASKLAAIFLRGTRGAGKAVYEEKGRDIYDLLWYMGKKIIPDFDYLKAKGIEMKNPRELFDKLTIQMNKVSDENLKQDLSVLFTDQTFILNWLKNWRESYFNLLAEYKINTVKGFNQLVIFQDLRTDNFYFHYYYNTEEGGRVRITYVLSDYWVEFKEGDLTLKVDKNIADKITFESNGVRICPHSAPNEKLKQYAMLFFKKTEDYFKKTNKIMLGVGITTKLIRMTAQNLNSKEQIVFNKSALLSCELEDLLK